MAGGINTRAHYALRAAGMANRVACGDALPMNMSERECPRRNVPFFIYLKFAKGI
jgi:hypothetical protein